MFFKITSKLFWEIYQIKPNILHNPKHLIKNINVHRISMEYIQSTGNLNIYTINNVFK